MKVIFLSVRSAWEAKAFVIEVVIWVLSTAMKPSNIHADELFEFHRKALKWEWVAGQQAKERHFDEVAVRAARSAADLVGYLNYIHPYRVQVMGSREAAYIASSGEDDSERRVARIVDLEPPALVLCDGETPNPALLALCEEAQIPLFTTSESAARVIDVLRA